MAKKISKAQQAKRDAERAKLIVLSCQAKEQTLLLAAMTGQELSVNQMLVMNYETETGCKTFKTFHDWKKDGYRVKKGETALRVWGKPIKGKAEDESAEAGEEKQFKMFPMCCLFNENQVEPLDADDTTASHESEPAPVTPAKVQVKVGEFRDCVAHLERVFNVDRCACVGDKEKVHWREICERVLGEAEALECSRAKPEDLGRRLSIVTKVKIYLTEPPTPPKPTKNVERRAETVKDAMSHHTQDMGNNENLSRGLFPQADGSYLAITFSESVTFKTKQGAVNWLAKRGVDAAGLRAETAPEAVELVKSEPSPFVSSDYQEQQEDRKDRLEGRAANKRQQSDEQYRKSHTLV